MMPLYYILNGDEKQGPHDIVSLIRKVKNGSLTPEHLLLEETSQTEMKAGDIEVLNDYFNDGTSPDEHDTHKASKPLSLIQLLNLGRHYYSHNQSISICVGLGGLVVVAFSLMTSAILPSFLSLILSCALATNAFAIFLIYQYENEHKNSSETTFFGQFKSKQGFEFIAINGIIGTACFAIPLLLFSTLGIAGVLFVLLGCFAYSYTLFAPLYWADSHNQTPYAQQVMQSKDWVKTQDIDTIGTIACLFTMAASSFLAFLFPSFMALPICGHAILEIYRRDAHHNI